MSNQMTVAGKTVKRWTPEEDAFLMENCTRMSTPEIAKQLNRTPKACYARIYTLGGAGCDRRNKWLPEHEQILIENCSTKTDKEIAEMLGPGFTEIAVEKHRHYMGLSEPKGENWGKDEIDWLIENYHKLPMDKLQEHLGRSTQAIFSKAGKLGLKRRGQVQTTPGREWTQQEEAFLRKYWGRVAPDLLAKKLRMKSAEVCWKASSLGLPMVNRAWTNEEDDILRKSTGMSAVAVQKQLPHRRADEIYRRRLQLGIKGAYKVGGRAWEQNELDYIQSGSVLTDGLEVAANRLNRTVGAVKYKCQELGVPWSRNEAVAAWSDKELEYLEKSWGTVPVDEMSKKLGRTIAAIKARAQKQNLGNWKDASELIPAVQIFKAIYPDAGAADAARRVSTLEARHGLPVIHRRYGVSRVYNMLSIDEFWKWARDHMEKLNFSRFEPLALGPEPKWVAIKRRQDRQDMYAHQRSAELSPWTAEEDEMLREMFSHKATTVAEVATKLGRTEAAVLSRADKIKAVYMGPRNRHIWTREEEDRLAGLIQDKSNTSWRQIALKMGLTEKQCKDHVRKAYKIQELPEVRKLMTQAGGWKRIAKGVNDFDKYFQQNRCAHFDKFKGCLLGHDGCDDCLEFKLKARV